MLRRVRHCNIHVPILSLIRQRYSNSHITSPMTSQICYLTSHGNRHVTSHTICCVTSHINSYRRGKYENSSRSNSRTNATAICDSVSSNSSCTDRNCYNNNNSSSNSNNSSSSSSSNTYNTYDTYYTSNNLLQSRTINTHTIHYKNGTRTSHSRHFFSTNAGTNNENNATKVLLRHFLFQIHPDYFLQVSRYEDIEQRKV